MESHPHSSEVHSTNRTQLVADLFCAMAAAATLGGYASILFRGDWTQTSWRDWIIAAILGGILLGWALLPYLAAFGINRLSRRARWTRIAACATSGIVSAIGLWSMFHIHQNHMMHMRDPNLMNCFGPVLEIGTPVAQFTLLVPAALLVTLGRGSNGNGHRVRNTVFWGNLVTYLVFAGVFLSGWIVVNLIDAGWIGRVAALVGAGAVSNLVAHLFARSIAKPSGRAAIRRAQFSIAFGVIGGALLNLVGIVAGLIIGIVVHHVRSAR